MGGEVDEEEDEINVPGEVEEAVEELMTGLEDKVRLLPVYTRRRRDVSLA